MKLVQAYIRLVRPLNLGMIAFTLYMVRLFFFYPKPHLPVNEVMYALFSVSFVFVAAGGYIINDYYDIETDKINKPDKVLIGTIIPVRSALIVYWVLNICGIITGFLSCYMTGSPLLGTLFLFYLIGLWFYSYKLKSTFLFGNLLIGIFLAIVPLGAICIELCANSADTIFTHNEKVFIWEIMGGVAVFAFLSTVVREIVKDAEDIEGDTIIGCRTMPIVIGVGKTKWVIFFLFSLFNILLGCVQYEFRDFGIYPFIYFFVFIQAPILVIFYRLVKAAIAKDFHKISTWLKALMITGTIYVFIFASGAYSMYLFFNFLFNSL